MRCPVCKADNLQGPQCRRCKADLALLFALEDQRRRTLTEARRCLERGQWSDAAHHAATADWLRANEDTQRLLALAHLLAGDFAEAWQTYRNLRAAQESDRGG
jgi:hypothetical protein